MENRKSVPECIYDLSKEFFQAFAVVGFDMEGNPKRVVSYDSEMHRSALAYEVGELSRDMNAPSKVELNGEVVIRNKEDDGGEEWKGGAGA